MPAPIRLYDSRRQEVVNLQTVVDDEVRMYVCGPTVQSSPHVGHLRSALAYDLWRRWLEYRGYDVTLVRNVTDIDDKILTAATAAGDGERWWALAQRVEHEFADAYAALGIGRPTIEPRATGSIGDMIALIERLIAGGHAYRALDGTADVYFDTASWADYGELTHQRPDDMVSGEPDSSAKRNPRDFALWKTAKPTEPESASWESPWGRGRPGWHIECSAMSRRYLGSEFDIHGGGLDLRFPHHENELAQSRAAGDPFARHWLHNGLVNVNGQKMSKSLGNSMFAHHLLAQAEPLTVRYLLGQAHYRSTIDLHDGSLPEAASALERITTALARARRQGELPEVPVPDAFGAAMDEDLGVPQALAVVHDTVRALNQALDAGNDATQLAAEVQAMVRVLGIDPAESPWSTGSGSSADAALAVLVPRLLADRAAARDAKDWARADAVRDVLAEAGVTIEDGPDGTHWSV